MNKFFNYLKGVQEDEMLIKCMLVKAKWCMRIMERVESNKNITTNKFFNYSKGGT